MTNPLGHELLDDPATDPALVAHMLTDIARANRWLGGRAPVRHAFARLLTPDDRGAHLTLLDVGTGAGDLPRYIARWLRARQITLACVGLERLRPAAVLAHTHGLPTILGCASALPVRSHSVDFVLASQLAHHLDAHHLTHLFRECTRVARRGVIIADLRPSRWAGVGFRMAGAVLGLRAETVTDGVTSLRRGFTPARLRAAHDAAAVANADVASLPFARIVSWWRP